MTFKLVEDNGSTTLQIDVYEVIHDVLKASERQELIESLACADDVIDHVMSQVLEGFTENGFRGAECADMDTAIQRARLKIAKEGDYAVRKTIEDFERNVKDLKDTIEFYRKNWAPLRDGSW